MTIHTQPNVGIMDSIALNETSTVHNFNGSIAIRCLISHIVDAINVLSLFSEDPEPVMEPRFRAPHCETLNSGSKWPHTYRCIMFKRVQCIAGLVVYFTTYADSNFNYLTIEKQCLFTYSFRVSLSPLTSDGGKKRQANRGINEIRRTFI